jgi:hypothetical protein
MRNRIGICDIDALMEDAAACGFLNVSGSLFELGCGASADGDAGAFAREFFRHGAAKSFAGGRNDSYAAL